MSIPLWTPSSDRIAASRLEEFRRFIAPRHGDMPLEALHGWSVRESASFWSELWDFAGVVGAKGPPPYVSPGARVQDTRFFGGARLNYAENLLRWADGGQELVFWGEDKVQRRVTGTQLRRDVGSLQGALHACAITAGDRIAAILPNMPEAIVASLAAASIGAIWSSCSPDFGTQGVLDRFGQIAPKALVVCDGYFYAGKTLPLGDKIVDVLAGLPSVDHVIVVDYIGEAAQLVDRLSSKFDAVRCEVWGDVLAQVGPRDPSFAQLNFDHPLCILYSSGTTGVPKCIVHRAGGLLLKHLSEHLLHCDVRPGDRVFYFTTLGWMMWNWLVSGLACGASLLLYDGSPTSPDADSLWRYAQAEGCTHFGTSAKYIETLKKAGVTPGAAHELGALRAVCSTGSPLSHEGFAYVYEAIKSDLHLASISGGTDICGCFVLGNPTKPVWPGEIQGPAFGLMPDVTDEAGQHLARGKGELVCRNAFPSMPLGFWNDAEGVRYQSAYFDRIPGVWHHGDFAEWTQHGGLIIHGRSDATLNPGGVRIGTAEIYRVLESIDEVQDAVCVGQPWQGDVRVVLFVVMKPGYELTPEVAGQIKERIRRGASPRHVPAIVAAVTDVPRTRSGKISELAVRDTVMGLAVKNTEALANPQCLEQFVSGPWQ